MEKQIKINKPELYIAKYVVLYNDGIIKYLMPEKYKVYLNKSDAETFILKYNTTMKAQHREILHYEIHVANIGLDWDEIEKYRQEMGYKNG